MTLTGKIVAISRDKLYYKVGVSSEDSIWYTKTSEVDVVCAELEVGWKVTIDYDWDEKKKKGFLSNVEILEKTTKESEEKDRDRKKSIERQAMMKCACEAVKGIPGIDIASLKDIIIDLYTAMYRKIQE